MFPVAVVLAALQILTAVVFSHGCSVLQHRCEEDTDAVFYGSGAEIDSSGLYAVRSSRAGHTDDFTILARVGPAYAAVCQEKAWEQKKKRDSGSKILGKRFTRPSQTIVERRLAMSGDTSRKHDLTRHKQPAKQALLPLRTTSL